MSYDNSFRFIECSLKGTDLDEDSWEDLFQSGRLKGRYDDLPWLSPANNHDTCTGRSVKRELQQLAKELPGLLLTMEVSWDPMGSMEHVTNTRWRVANGKLYESEEVIVVEWGEWQEVSDTP